MLVSLVRFILIVLAYVIGLPLFGIMYGVAVLADRWERIWLTSVSTS
jgi:hypothetical protein